jgi:hypothetical protein
MACYEYYVRTNQPLSKTGSMKKFAVTESAMRRLDRDAPPRGYRRRGAYTYLPSVIIRESVKRHKNLTRMLAYKDGLEKKRARVEAERAKVPIRRKQVEDAVEAAGLINLYRRAYLGQVDGYYTIERWVRSGVSGKFSEKEIFDTFIRGLKYLQDSQERSQKIKEACDAMSLQRASRYLGGGDDIDDVLNSYSRDHSMEWESAIQKLEEIKRGRDERMEQLSKIAGFLQIDFKDFQDRSTADPVKVAEGGDTKLWEEELYRGEIRSRVRMGVNSVSHFVNRHDLANGLKCVEGMVLVKVCREMPEVFKSLRNHYTPLLFDRTLMTQGINQIVTNRANMVNFNGDGSQLLENCCYAYPSVEDAANVFIELLEARYERSLVLFEEASKITSVASLQRPLCQERRFSRILSGEAVLTPDFGQEIQKEQSETESDLVGMLEMCGEDLETIKNKGQGFDEMSDYLRFCLTIGANDSVLKLAQMYLYGFECEEASSVADIKEFAEKHPWIKTEPENFCASGLSHRFWHTFEYKRQNLLCGKITALLGDTDQGEDGASYTSHYHYHNLNVSALLDWEHSETGDEADLNKYFGNLAAGEKQYLFTVPCLDHHGSGSIKPEWGLNFMTGAGTMVVHPEDVMENENEKVEDEASFVYNEANRFEYLHRGSMYDDSSSDDGYYGGGNPFGFHNIMFNLLGW